MSKRVDPDVIIRAAESVYTNWICTLGLDAALAACESLLEDLQHEKNRRAKMKKGK
ncbi:MAG: hypothetical protein GY934_05110 [Gammaproteobacteria bacterium]|nr:hypothetical protein [Gammaproteobacteria bacterium]